MKTVSRKCNIRNYTYTAHLTEAGKLSFIQAGCRKWKTFAAAIVHYDGLGPKGDRWSDAKVDAHATPKLEYAHRREARGLLEKLEVDVRLAQKRIRARNRRRRQGGA